MLFLGVIARVFRAGLVFVVGCSSEERIYNFDDGGSGDARPPTGQLVIEGETTLRLTFEEQRVLTVRYVEEGTPVRGAHLALALVGTAQDSRLSALDVTTDDEGRASVQLTAGTTRATFRVRISADRVAEATIDVSVSDGGFGGILVRAPYRGPRPVTQRSVLVFSDMECGSMLDLDAPGRAIISTDPTIDISIESLPAGGRYAVVVQAQSSSATTLAHACKDGVLVAPDQTTQVDLRLDPIGLSADGRYTAELGLDAESASERLRTELEEAGLGIVERAGGDSGLLLDALETELRRLGAIPTADALAMDRASTGIEASLGVRLSSARVGPSTAIADLAIELDLRSRWIILSSVLHIDVAEAEPVSWTPIAIRAGSTADDDRPLSLDLDAAGLRSTATLSATLDAFADTITLDSAAFDLRLGKVGRAVLAAIAAERAVATTAELLAPVGGCSTFRTWLTPRSSLRASCDDSCVDAVCTAALEQVADGALERIDALDTSFARITLSGAGTLETHGDETVSVDVLVLASLEASWHSVGEPTGIAMMAELHAERIAASPP